VLTAPRHPYVRGLIDAVPSLDEHNRLIGIAGQAPDPAERGPGCAFEPRCPHSLPACLTPPPSVQVGPGHEVWCVRAAGGLSLVKAGRELAVEQHRAAEAPLLSIRELRAWHGSREILHSIGLDVAEGVCVALVGESGSGKTTLARCVAGIHAAYRGEIWLGDGLLARGARARTASERTAVQYIFQNPYASLNPRRIIIETIAQPLLEISELGRREIQARAEDALDQVSLSRNTGLRYPHELSGGQRQRVAIARALVVAPRLLVCDEVTSALDVSVQGIVTELLDRLRREHNLALLFVTHNLALVSSVAQQVVVMRAGEIVERGGVREVLARPRTDTTTKLLKDVPRMPAQAQIKSPAGA
ncbi:MAG: oligopeptide/dipeptide ABC transporter ATP-binding protein, partial [Solirubrobacteraceae bacterium]